MEEIKDCNITVGELIKLLQVERPERPLYFGGLNFSRLKDKGALVNFEFLQSVYRDNDGYVVVGNTDLPPREKTS